MLTSAKEVFQMRSLSFSAYPVQFQSAGTLSSPRFRGSNVDKSPETDTFELSSKRPTEDHLEAAKRYAANKGLDASAFHRFLNLGRKTFAEPPHKKELLDKPDIVNDELLKKSAQLGEVVFSTLEEQKVPEKLSKCLLRAITDTFSKEELEKLNKLYEDPETASLLNRQMAIFAKLLKNPAFETEVESVIRTIEDNAFSLLLPGQTQEGGELPTSKPAPKS
jgi:hypothetical protein